ncbi:DUF6602 domain-containing protein [Ochrobactrum chromiisoli]|uniref:DUF6602 domain-containing protein n=1 Tax=Ochrobactrum chromiisoli TaxID=2993941 RepID=UPI0022494B17|nr:DUF6602 domain-containing protein [Ochrobactrum chromiisoli]
MDFKDLFTHQQKILELELEVARTRFEHLGLRGNALEIASRDFFEKHLPRSVNVGTGEVIASESDNDSAGARSGQMDLVFSNQSQPFPTARDIPTLFFHRRGTSRRRSENQFVALRHAGRIEESSEVSCITCKEHVSASTGH